MFANYPSPRPNLGKVISVQTNWPALKLRKGLLVFLFCSALVICVSASSTLAQSAVHHMLYAVDKDGPSILYVYDLDNSFALVTQLNIPTAYTGVDVRGLVADASAGMLYISHGCYYLPGPTICGGKGGYLAKYNFLTNQLVWDVEYSTGIDSHSITPDGKTIYMPLGENSGSSLWDIIDTSTGSVVGTIDSGQTGSHNTIVSNDGTHVFMGSTHGAYLAEAGTATQAILQKVGPTQNSSIRPFTIDSTQTFSFTTSTDFLGFQVGDIATGTILYSVPVGGSFAAACAAHPGQPCSHGITLSPDDKEIYVTDIYNNYMHVYDVSGLPGTAPSLVADIPLAHPFATTGWPTHTRDGRYVLVGGSGDVIDTTTHQVVGYIPALGQTEKFTEIDFQNGVPVFAPLSRSGVGYVGGSQTPAVTLSPSTLTFVSQTVGTTSSAQTVTLSNNGSSALSVTGIAVTGANSGDFLETNTCGSSVAAGGNCAISVTFTPTATGTRTASVTITDSDPSSPQTVGLTGTGAAGTTTASASPGTLTYASQTVGTTSGAQAVTLSNTGSAALTISSIAVTGANSGDFLETNTCGSTVAAGGSCGISVTFKPTGAGTRTGTLTISDNATGGPQTVSLTGTGAAGTTTASASPGTLTYASQTVGTTSGAQAVTLSNTGSAALTISSIAVTGANSGDFLETNTCGNTVAGGGSCGISVTFKPTGAGTRTGTLTISDNATGGPQTVSLTGTGAAGTTTASASPGTLTYASQTVGTTSGAQAVTLSNTGSAALTISSIAVTGANSGDFLETNTCGNTVAGGGSCGISVTFKPTGAGTRTGTLTISDNATGGPQTVSLTGTGAAGTTTASASPGTLTYASQTVGTTSGAQAVTLSNTGSAALTISSIAVTGANSGDFLETNTCGSTVAGGGSCGISVTFKPTGAGTRTGTLTISDNATGGPQTVSLTGTGAAASGGDFTLSSSPSSLAVTSGQTGSLTVSVSSSGGFNQAVSLSCQGAPQAASCTVNPGSLTPTGTGMVSANVKVTTTAYTMGVPEQGPQWVVPPRGGAELLRVVTVFVLLMLAGILGKKERVRAAVGVAALGVMLVGSGCAGIAESKGSGGGHSGTPPGSYTLTLTGTAGTGANAITHSTTVTLMVQ